VLEVVKSRQPGTGGHTPSEWDVAAAANETVVVFHVNPVV